MKRTRFLLLVILLAVGLSATASCSGSGSGDNVSGDLDFASVSVEGGQTVRYTLTANGSAPNGFSPDLWSISTSTNNAHIYCSEWANNADVMRLEVDVYDYAAGLHTGSYSITDPGNQILFSPEGGDRYGTSSAATGTVTITEIGGNGGKIKGTFDVIVEVNSVPTSTARLTGSFSVTRWFAP